MILRIRKCTPIISNIKHFPLNKNILSIILNNDLLLSNTRKNISCETRWYVIWLPSLWTRQVLYCFIYHWGQSTICVVCPVWRLWVQRREAGRRQRERETSSWAPILRSPECTRVLHSTGGHSWRRRGVRNSETQTRDQWLWHRPGAHQTVSVALCPGPRSSVWLRLWPF